MKEVVQGVAVDGDHVLVRRQRRREGEGGAVSAAQAVGPEVGQVLALGGIGGIVPVADVHHPQAVVGLREGPGQEAATGPSAGSSPISRRASSWPTCSRLGSGVYGASGLTKSFCRHWVINTPSPAFLLSKASRTETVK